MVRIAEDQQAGVGHGDVCVLTAEVHGVFIRGRAKHGARRQQAADAARTVLRAGEVEALGVLAREAAYGRGSKRCPDTLDDQIK